MTCLFLRQGLHVVFELFDRDVRVGSSLLLRLDDLVQLAQLRVKPRQRRTLFLQPALRLTVLRLPSSFRSEGFGDCVQSAQGTISWTGVCVHTSLFATLSVSDLSSWRILSIPAEALESVSRAAAMSDSICSVSTTDFSDRDDGKNCYTFTDQAPVSPCAFLSVESSRPQLASAMPPFVSEYSPERRN